MIHGHIESMGPAAKFALEAKPGDRVEFLDQGSAFTPDHPHDWTLLVGDETALPAIAGICRALPKSARGIAIIEIPSAEDKQNFDAPADMDIKWVVREESAQSYEKPGSLPSRHWQRRRFRTAKYTPTPSVKQDLSPVHAAISSRSAGFRNATWTLLGIGVMGVCKQAR